MEEKSHAKEPLLYIQQPTLKKPKVHMQTQYKTPNQSTKTHRSDPQSKTSNSIQSGIDHTTKNTSKKIFKRNYLAEVEAFKEKQADNNESTEVVDVEEDHDDHDRSARPFKDLSLKERVLYFVNKPSYAPQVRCELKTDERTYRGKIVDYKDDVVYMNVGRRRVQIPFNTIKQINLLGF